MIRSKNGGGTRTAEMLGTSGNMDVISYAKKVVFFLMEKALSVQRMMLSFILETFLTKRLV